MKLRIATLLLVFLAVPLYAKRRAVTPPVSPAEQARQSILAASALVADRIYLTHQIDRRSWEDGIFMMGQLRLGEAMNARAAHSGDRFVERAVDYVGTGESYIAGGNWTTYAQTALELYRYLPPNDPRRAGLLTAIQKPLQFAFTAFTITPALGTPQGWWWVDGGYGTQFWQDDLYMIHAWLAMAGSVENGLPGDPLANMLAWEWWESYIYDHRPDSLDPRERAVPSDPMRHGYFLWSPKDGLFYHDPTVVGTDNFWGRGNGWAMYGLASAVEYMNRPFAGGLYPQTVSRGDLVAILQQMSSSLMTRRTPGGGWGTSLSHPESCPVAETSATALIAFGLAKGVNMGWLDHDTYAPAVLQAYKVLQANVSPAGDVQNIQPPWDRPSCSFWATDNPNTDLNFGPGAFLMLSSEVLKLPEEDLAKLAK